MQELPFPREKSHPPVEVLRGGEINPYGNDNTCYREKGTKDWLLMLTVKGRAIVATGNTQVDVREGVVTLYHPNTPQHYFTNPSVGWWEAVWSHFHSPVKWQEWMDWPEAAKGLRVVTLDDNEVMQNACNAVRESTRFAQQHLPESTAMAVNALERAILWINTANHSRKLDPRVRKAINLLSDNMQKTISVEDLALECGLSPSRFSHLFRSQVGIPPQAYIEKLKLQRASQLLRHANAPVGEIAEEVGYANIFYFSNRFKKLFGKSPSEYRKQ